MIAFTVYDKATGQIHRSGFVRADTDAALQPAAGESVLLGSAANPRTQRVDLTTTPPAVVPVPP